MPALPDLGYRGLHSCYENLKGIRLAACLMRTRYSRRGHAPDYLFLVRQLRGIRQISQQIVWTLTVFFKQLLSDTTLNYENRRTTS